MNYVGIFSASSRGSNGPTFPATNQQVKRVQRFADWVRPEEKGFESYDPIRGCWLIQLQTTGHRYPAQCSRISMPLPHFPSH